VARGAGVRTRTLGRGGAPGGRSRRGVARMGRWTRARLRFAVNGAGCGAGGAVRAGRTVGGSWETVTMLDRDGLLDFGRAGAWEALRAIDRVSLSTAGFAAHAGR